MQKCPLMTMCDSAIMLPKANANVFHASGSEMAIELSKATAPLAAFPPSVWQHI